MKNKLVSALMYVLLGIWALAAIGVFVNLVSSSFNCSFFKAIIMSILCTVLPIAFVVIPDRLAERIKEILQEKTALPVFLTETSLKIISVTVSFVGFLSASALLVLATLKAPI